MAEREARRVSMVEGVDVPPEHLRLLCKVARMYHERGLRQPEIAAQLHISQPRVSRLLKKAVETGIVRTTVVTPRGIHAELEDLVEQRYDLRDVIVADTGEQADERVLLPALGAAAAEYLETTLTGADRIGISSWSSTLLTGVEMMRSRPAKMADSVVQVLGGLGAQNAQAHATRLTVRLAQVTGAEAVYLPAPGLVGSSTTRDALVADGHVASVMATYPELTVLLAGVGSLEPSELLRESGNAVAESEQEELRAQGAVGDICLRFFDEAGAHVPSGLDDRVIGIDATTLRTIPRRVAVAGGERKFTAIRAALRGDWANVLITDLSTAQRLADAA
ncbi:MAG: sugar-binding domain-containing protein [Actinomycetota bacterium]|nr:sugar-binding domain-containing protein [Actinomycetota bacterium]